MVTFAEFKEQAAALSVEQRASLASFLLHSLPDPDYDVSDEEVAERFRQAKSGEVEMMTFDQLKADVFPDRLPMPWPCGRLPWRAERPMP